ncbi:hypothetical protein GTW40_04880, partial [Streptomyces sp. SID4985]
PTAAAHPEPDASARTDAGGPAGTASGAEADQPENHPTPAAPAHQTPQTPGGTWLDAETALTLLTSPLAGMDAADLRRLGRALREEERAGGNPVPPPSDELLARALAEPER